MSISPVPNAEKCSLQAQKKKQGDSSFTVKIACDNPDSWCHYTAKDLKGVFAQSQNPNLNLSPIWGSLWHTDMKMKAFYSLSGNKCPESEQKKDPLHEVK